MTAIKPVEAVDVDPAMSVSFRPTREIRTGHWRTFRPSYATRPSPCMLDCPAGTDVRRFLALAAAGDVAGAWHELLLANPLPGVCGRVCYHPCELQCQRGALDEPVAVQATERAVADEARRRRIDPEAIGASPMVKRVGVVGAGPAGLSCAYQLARLGYPVTVFDENREAGGMLRYGIPEYRLPRAALDRELALLARVGIAFVNGVRVGPSGAPELSAFAALFLATGASRPRHVRIPGDALPGVEAGLDFLRQVNSGRERRLLGRTVIVGGGNTAVDAARVALRLGAPATIVYRRTRRDMPAHPDEVAAAEAEGVELVFGAAPARILEKSGRVSGLELQRMRPGPPDASGRSAPEPVPGRTFVLAARHVLLAVGEEVDVETLHAFALPVHGRLRADHWGRTRRPSVFAGGDAATGAGTVADAIGSGRRAAEAIDAHLRGRDVVEELGAGRVDAADLNLFYFPPSARTRPPAHDPLRAARGFDEIVGGLSWEQAVAEARRCFSCGLCTGCDNCYVFCPEAAITPDRATGTYDVDLTHCKGCGLCAAECPRGAVTLVPEDAR